MTEYRPQGFNIIIRNTADYGVDQGIKTLVYGRAGVGKTRLLATAPGPICLSAEAGVLSLRQYNIPYIPIMDITSFREASRWCFSSMEARQFGTFGIDSSSEIAEQILAYEKTRNKDPRRAYGEVAEQMLFILRQFRDWQGPNVYFTAKQETDNVNGVFYCKPSMPGRQLPDQVPYFPDEIWQLNVTKDAQGQEVNYLRCKADAYNDAKDRSGALSEYEQVWFHPNHGLTYLFNKIHGRK